MIDLCALYFVDYHPQHEHNKVTLLLCRWYFSVTSNGHYFGVSAGQTSYICIVKLAKVITLAREKFWTRITPISHFRPILGCLPGDFCVHLSAPKTKKTSDFDVSQRDLSGHMLKIFWGVAVA